ncbi:unnamed protein product [Schistosoma curassoni]|uniref:Secreted protein n=1 Tax=Schistosoma curassoni TaxID=6186 RepID=A0A183JS86_9TREM|nr:unnamed protein product [Schistosoma curassoni]
MHLLSVVIACFRFKLISDFFICLQDYNYSNKEILRTGQDNDIFDASPNADEFPDVFEPSQLRLVESALCSGLPNEIEVALNSLLVLSITPSSGSSTSVRLAHCTNLLSLLVASVGIYGEGKRKSFIVIYIYREVPFSLYCKKRLISSDCSWSLIFPLYKKERKSCFHCHKGIFSNIGSKILASVIIYGLSGVCLQQTERLFSDLGASSNFSGIDLQTDPFFDLKCSYVIILSVED